MGKVRVTWLFVILQMWARVLFYAPVNGMTPAPIQGSRRPSPVCGTLSHMPGIPCIKWDLINRETKENCSHPSEWQRTQQAGFGHQSQARSWACFPWELTRDTVTTFFSQGPPEACLASPRTEFTNSGSWCTSGGAWASQQEDVGKGPTGSGF